MFQEFRTERGRKSKGMRRGATGVIIYELTDGNGFYIGIHQRRKRKAAEARNGNERRNLRRCKYLQIYTYLKIREREDIQILQYGKTRRLAYASMGLRKYTTAQMCKNTDM